MKICPLCNNNLATKTNCHIYPRFFGETLKNSGKYKRVYQLNEDEILGITRFRQDTSKEDYLLCPQCESFLGDELEDHVAKKFYHVRYDNGYFSRTRLEDGFFHKTFPDLDYQIFKRLAYSMVFRASIATNFPFSEFNLDRTQEDYFADLILGKTDFQDIPLYVFIQQTNKPMRNIMGIRHFNKNKDVFHLIINDLMIIIAPVSDPVLEENYKDYITDNILAIRFFEVPEAKWNDWINNIMIKVKYQIVKDRISELISILINRVTKS